MVGDVPSMALYVCLLVCLSVCLFVCVCLLLSFVLSVVVGVCLLLSARAATGLRVWLHGFTQKLGWAFWAKHKRAR